MEKNKKVWLFGFLCGLGATATAVAAYVLVFYLFYGVLPIGGNGLASGETMKKIALIESLVDKNYLEEVDDQELEEGIYAGMVAMLQDPYSGYFSSEDYKALVQSTEGKYTGLGVALQQDMETKEVTVGQCYPDSPAEKAGVLVGDIIYKVDDQLMTETTITEVASAIKNGENDEVTLTIIREGEEEMLEITVHLEEVVVPVIESKMLEGDQGYIKISSFTEGTPQQFQEAYDTLTDQKMKSLIIDVRDNPGGLLNSVCDTLEQILPEGLIVYTQDKYGKKVEHTCEGKTPIDIPVAVLVNENSASAAEIFAGAMKDHGVATLVGVTTYGKGIVQTTYPLGDGSAVKLTTSSYYTPNGVNIHGVGIEPDIQVEMTDDKDDTQLEKACEILQ